ncbi:alanine--tRNA ligase [Candidatus Woesearchaeota archaeon]|nr:MAG: alanine--tRNA ligase [Candidatus Woesearchaeota archaeon]
MMKTDKELKKEFKAKASDNPEKYYATQILKKEGFYRNTCVSCGTTFWNVDPKREICGDPSCVGGFNVVSNNPSKNTLSYIDVWKTFEEHMKKEGYASISRYPVIARWNPTTYFTIASIAAFQPFVISGEVEPPAPKLVIPQFCLRFGDVDNVGVTGSHCTGFVMIGQHQFVSPQEWDQNKAFQDLYSYITSVVGLDKTELTLHEDAWAGGGNFGPCMEFFSRGVELCNQVYMMFEQLEDGSIKELNIKVLDMGLGQERIAWFSQGTPNMYEAVFPSVLSKLKEATQAEYDTGLFKQFSSYSALLNIDEVEDINKAWETVASKLDIDVQVLREKVWPMVGLYSIAEHTRSLLFAIADGGLPSNVGGGYNLRVILRRALSFIDEFNWNVDLKDVATWHAQELEPIFPELKKQLPQVQKILDVEKEKYISSKNQASRLVKKIVQKEVSVDDLVELYDSHGISPKTIQQEARKLGKTITIPDNFFQLLAQRHEQKEQKTATKKVRDIDVANIPPSKAKYFDDWKQVTFEATIVAIQGNYVALDETYFYPTSGGQLHDLGTIGDAKIKDIFKQDHVIIHEVEDASSLSVGEKVSCTIDFERRKQLTQHHTSTHIINGAARTLLGDHIWQAGAAKSTEKARLDITHYEALSQELLDRIEEKANEIVKKGIPIEKYFLKRSEAEKKFGMRLYQGGAVPGSIIRVVDIGGFDVEACGGTHLNNTSEAEVIKIIKSSKVQDGVVRLEFAAGNAARALEKQESGIIEDAAKLLECSPSQVPGRAAELFSLWKQIVKKKKDVPFKLTSTQEFSGDLLQLTCKELKTQPEHILKTISRFLEDIRGRLS